MNEQRIAYHQFFGEILNRVPEFTACYRAHDDDGTDDLLCDLVDLLVTAHENAVAEDVTHQGVSDLALRILGALEDAVGNSDYAFDAKFVNVVLPRIFTHGPAGARVCQHLGPRLAALKLATTGD